MLSADGDLEVALMTEIDLPISRATLLVWLATARLITRCKMVS